MFFYHSNKDRWNIWLLVAGIVAAIIFFMNFTDAYSYEIKKFESPDYSFIKEASYNPETKKMVIKMNDKQGNSKYYKYKNVSSKRFDNFSKSSSKGKYFNKKIRGKYDYERIK